MSELIYQSIHTGTKIDEAVSKVPALTEQINSLDAIKADVETGTWTPTIGGQTSDPTVSYTIQEGTFVKVGKLIYLTFFIRASLTGGEERVLIRNIPVARKSGRIQGIGYASIGSTQKGIMRIGSVVGASTLNLNTANNSDFVLSEINNGDTCDIMGSIIYEF